MGILNGKFYQLLFSSEAGLLSYCATFYAFQMRPFFGKDGGSHSHVLLPFQFLGQEKN